LLRTLVCARPPCRYRCETFVSSTRLRGFHAAARSHTIKRRIVPLTGFGSPSGYHPCCTVDCGAHEPHGQQADHTTPSPTLYYLPRFGPLQCFSAAQSYLAPAGSNPLVRLRPQGFAPSRRFVPRATMRAYFLPLPLMGFPFEALFHMQRRTPFRTPGPSWLAPHRV
jgi:hypothetical protein